MKRTIAIDLPVLLQGNIHHVDVPLLYDVLGKIKGLKNVEVLFCNDDLQILFANDYAFSGNILKFLSDVKLSEYEETSRKENLTYTPDIVAGLEKNMSNAVYLQLCVIHTNDTTGSEITFTGFIPRFSEKFKLKTTRDKKTRPHETVIIESGEDANDWIESCKPSLSELKHKGTTGTSARGVVSPFTSLFKIGKEYAESLLQRAYLESEDNAVFPHYLYTWDPEAGTFIEFRHENHENDSEHNYHGRDMSEAEYKDVPSHIREKYHR